MSIKQTSAGDYFNNMPTSNITGNWVVNPNPITGMPFPNATTGPFTWHTTNLDNDMREVLMDLQAQINILAGEVMKLRKELRGFKSRNRKVRRKSV